MQVCKSFELISSDFPANCKVSQLSSSPDWLKCIKEGFGMIDTYWDKNPPKSGGGMKFFCSDWKKLRQIDFIVIRCLSKLDNGAHWVIHRWRRDIHRTWGCLANKEWIKIDGTGSSPNGLSLRILRLRIDKKEKEDIFALIHNGTKTLNASYQSSASQRKLIHL